MTAEYQDGAIARAPLSAGSADAVRQALVQAGRGADGSRWPGLEFLNHQFEEVHPASHSARTLAW